MKKLSNYLAIILVSLAVTSCVTEKKPQEEKNAVIVEQEVVKSILTAEEQGNMSPDEIIGRLKKGNENFVGNNLTKRDHSAQRRLAMIGQYPKAEP